MYKLKLDRLYTNSKFHFDNGFWHDPKFYDSILIYQIGDLCCDSGYVVKEHEQECYEITYIASGKGYFSTNNIKYPVSEGDIFLSLPGEIHAGKADAADPFRYFYVGFKFEYCEKNQNPFSHVQNMFHKVAAHVIRDKMDIQTPFVSIFNEIIHVKDYSNLIIKSCIHQIVIFVYRNFFDSWGNAYIPEKDITDTNAIIYKLVNYIDNNLLSIGDLSKVADMLGYSYTYLSHLFSREMGLTILGYYNKKRFEKAIEWLEKEEFSVTEIADKLGYQSIHPFSKAFKKVTGLSPAQYKSLHSNSAKSDK